MRAHADDDQPFRILGTARVAFRIRQLGQRDSACLLDPLRRTAVDEDRLAAPTKPCALAWLDRRQVRLDRRQRQRVRGRVHRVDERPQRGARAERAERAGGENQEVAPLHVAMAGTAGRGMGGSRHESSSSFSHGVRSALDRRRASRAGAARKRASYRRMPPQSSVSPRAGPGCATTCRSRLRAPAAMTGERTMGIIKALNLAKRLRGAATTGRASRNRQKSPPCALPFSSPTLPRIAGPCCASAPASGVAADVVGPCGFVWSDAKLRRAGMDYLDQVELRRHESWVGLPGGARARAPGPADHARRHRPARLRLPRRRHADGRAARAPARRPRSMTRRTRGCSSRWQRARVRSMSPWPRRWRWARHCARPANGPPTPRSRSPHDPAQGRAEGRGGRVVRVAARPDLRGLRADRGRAGRHACRAAARPLRAQAVGAAGRRRRRHVA